MTFAASVEEELKSFIDLVTKVRKPLHTAFVCS